MKRHPCDRGLGQFFGDQTPLVGYSLPFKNTKKPKHLLSRKSYFSQLIFSTTKKWIITKIVRVADHAIIPFSALLALLDYPDPPVARDYPELEYVWITQWPRVPLFYPLEKL
jgi:hypothetical protein